MNCALSDLFFDSLAAGKRPPRDLRGVGLCFPFLLALQAFFGELSVANLICIPVLHLMNIMWLMIFTCLAAAAKQQLGNGRCLFYVLCSCCRLRGLFSRSANSATKQEDW